MTNIRNKFTFATVGLAACALLVAACADGEPSGDASGAAEQVVDATVQVAYSSPEEAVQALEAQIGTGDRAGAERLFGADGIDLLLSGDEVQDRQAFDRVKAEIRERVAFEDGEDGSKVALFGNEGWPFPVPLVRGADGWMFDVEAGWEEIENRRVGRNELLTIDTLHELVDAQREYAAVGRDGNPKAFAQKLFSTEGKHDGLYWQVAEGETPSPFAAEIAEAAAEGYRRSEDGPKPFHGYRYRLLTAQGPSAPGGAKSYLDARGLLTGGFAAVAWPAKYGNSGVKTFLVSHQGIVFERDLGDDTESLVAAITTYDPGEDWHPTRDE